MAEHDPADLVDHYSRDGGALAAILAALTDAGIDVAQPPIPAEALSGADEFHLGGAAATAALVEDLGLAPHDRVLDVGCGAGGPARSMARLAGCEVTGVDLTPGFVDAATELSRLAGLAGTTSFLVGDAAELGLPEASFDVATMFHVGMNLPDKAAVFAAVRRLLQPGGRFAVYDIMLTGEGELEFPVPWSSSPDTSHLATPDEYVAALTDAGFEVGEPVSRRQLVVDALARAAAEPPTVNLVHLMGPEFPTMIGNLGAAFRDGIVTPIQLIARR
ncbi:MAG: class I SAM-dependent methyltransferase [Actinomycetota bacterium]